MFSHELQLFFFLSVHLAVCKFVCNLIVYVCHYKFKMEVLIAYLKPVNPHEIVEETSKHCSSRSLLVVPVVGLEPTYHI